MSEKLYRRPIRWPGFELVECLRCGAFVALVAKGDHDVHAEWHALERRLLAMAHGHNDGPEPARWRDSCTCHPVLEKRGGLHWGDCPQADGDADG